MDAVGLGTVVPESRDLSARPAPIRVVIVISNLEYGGAQRQVVEFMNHVDPARADVHACALSRYVPLASDIRGADARLHVILKRFKFDVTVVPRLARLLRRLSADVVHGYLFDAELAARLAGTLAGTPLIVGSERNTDYTLKRRQLITYRLTRRCADLVIANSNAGAAFNERLLGHHRSKYRVVHNGVDTSRFRPGNGHAARRALGIADDEPVVGMFASFKHQKNHPLFFAAARPLIAAIPSVRFLLVGNQLYGGMHGSDEYKKRIDRLVDELGVRQRCVFAGNRDDVQTLYPACDVTVLPSLFEGTPNVALESMACGVPIVATDVSDNALVIPDGKVGYIVPLGDEAALTERIRDLLQDHQKRATMGRHAREWVEAQFSSTRLAEKMTTVYEEALAGRRRARPPA